MHLVSVNLLQECLVVLLDVGLRFAHLFVELLEELGRVCGNSFEGHVSLLHLDLQYAHYPSELRDRTE